jgi:dihydroorotate dehydrogenase (NAD+) catalytic subunit
LTGEDAIEMIMAGATLVGVGTAVYYRDIKCFGLIGREMVVWGKKHGVRRVGDLRGTAVKS